MSAALTAQPGLYSTATVISVKAKSKGKNRKRKKSNMSGGARATFVSFFDAYVVVTPPKIYFGEVLRVLEFVNELRDERERVVVLNHVLI